MLGWVGLGWVRMLSLAFASWLLLLVVYCTLTSSCWFGGELLMSMRVLVFEVPVHRWRTLCIHYYYLSACAFFSFTFYICFFRKTKKGFFLKLLNKHPLSFFVSDNNPRQRERTYNFKKTKKNNQDFKSIKNGLWTNYSSRDGASRRSSCSCDGQGSIRECGCWRKRCGR